MPLWLAILKEKNTDDFAMKLAQRLNRLIASTVLPPFSRGRMP
jgi:hypothetical protein